MSDWTKEEQTWYFNECKKCNYQPFHPNHAAANARIEELAQIESFRKTIDARKGGDICLDNMKSVEKEVGEDDDDYIAAITRIEKRAMINAIKECSEEVGEVKDPTDSTDNEDYYDDPHERVCECEFDDEYYAEQQMGAEAKVTRSDKTTTKTATGNGDAAETCVELVDEEVIDEPVHARRRPVVELVDDDDDDNDDNDDNNDDDDDEVEIIEQSYSRSTLKKLKRIQLVDIANGLNLKTDGTKLLIMERILKSYD